MTILYLSFYFEPDLCSGSFRNTSLVRELTRQLTPDDVIHVVTTQPNRYQSFKQTAPEHEEHQKAGQCRVIIDRVVVPPHASGLTDQMYSFWIYFRKTHRLAAGQSYDLVVASSSRLFTAFLGAKLARKNGISLFLDIRDLFREAIREIIANIVFRVSLDLLLSAVERYTFGYARHINIVSAGFRAYFKPFGQATYSNFPNGIDDEFLSFDLPSESIEKSAPNRVKRILYAGNIGLGQGLHKIIPQAARLLGDDYQFVIIGDGGAVNLLAEAIREADVQNVALQKPVSRRALVAEYRKADYLFVHLNDWEALTRVLPSKIMEYGATNKPILAGVAGYAAQFIRHNLPNSLVFLPGDAADFTQQLRAMPYQTGYRDAFRERFRRKSISVDMARQILATARPVGSPVSQPALV